MISITNAGRGSGKTYSLIQWAKESPNRFIVGTHAETGFAMEDAGLSDRFVHFVDAKGFFEGKEEYEVAIDDLNHVLSGLIEDEYGINAAAHNVLLTMNFPEARMGESNCIPLDVLSHSIEFIESLKKIFEGKK